MSDRFSYITRFIRRDGKPDEEYYFNTYEEARDHADSFTADDADLYEGIELARMDWYMHQDELLDYIKL